MTTTVLMLETRAAGASTVHQSGTQYPLSDDLASFYIGKGYATLISPQPANLVPVMGQVNPLTRGIEKATVGGKDIPYSALAGEGSFTSKRCAYLKCATATNDAAGYTYQTIMASEAPFNAVRIGLLNGEGGVVNVSKVIAGVRGSITTGAAAWSAVKFAGADAVSLPSKLGTNRPSVTWSDWILLQSVARNDGLGTLPLLYVRQLIAAAQTTYSTTPAADDLSWMAAAAGRVLKTERQNVDAVNTTANWTAGVAQTCAIPMVIEFAHTVRSITVLNVGDSIRLGSPSDIYMPCNGDAYQACAELSSASAPVSLVQAAWGGDSSDYYYNRAVDLINSLRPDVVLYSPFGVNDGTPVDYRISWELGRLSVVLAAAKSVGAKVVVANGMCNTSLAWNAAADAYRLQLNATLAQMGIPVIDQNSIASDLATPERFKSGASSDGLHPEAAIYTQITPLTKAAIQSVIF